MVIPDPRLPEPAMPWGRQLTQKTVDLEQQVGRLDNDTNNNLQQLNSSVQLLSQNVKILTQQNNDILGRRDIATNNTLSIAYGISRFNIVQGYLIGHTITLDAPRIVSTLGIATIAVGPYTQAREDLYIDGTLIYDGHPSTVPGSNSAWSAGYVMGNNQPNAYDIYSNFNSTAASTFQLTAGTHTLEYLYWANGSNTNSYVAYNAMFMRTSILGYV